MWTPGVEQGPIRPPSEAASVLVRVSRNCPWNKCAFCPVYKGARFSLRDADEVIAELDHLARAHGAGARSVFLQDADPLITPADDLVRILEAVRARFPRLERITTYARSRTLAKRPLADLQRIRQAGLNRVHVGLESGCDAVLTRIRKGTTRQEQIVAGRKAREAGFELSLYVMPGLGGVDLSDAHADDTASALVAIQPHFVRLRTTSVVRGTPLAELVDEGVMTMPGELALVAEIRRMLAAAEGLQTQLESDHSLNLLMELRGPLPAGRERLLAICDAVLALPEPARIRFALARRLGWRVAPEEVETPRVIQQMDAVLAEAQGQGLDAERLFARLRRRNV